MGEFNRTSVAPADGTVTVIIPVYNGERFICRALDSVLNQAHSVSQILVVDDGSTDATREIVKKYPVTLLCQQNGGPSRARNNGLRAASGEFIAFLDADDAWEPTKITEQLESFRQYPHAIANYTGLRVVNDAGEHLEDTVPTDPATLAHTLRWCNPGIPPSSVMLHRSAALEFDERHRGCEDWNLWCRLTKLGAFCICEQPLTVYRASNTGLSGDARRIFADFLGMVDDVLLADMSGVQRAIWRRRIISHQAFKAAMTARGATDRPAETAFMWKSLREWPSPFWTTERFRFFTVTLIRTGRRRYRAPDPVPVDLVNRELS